MRRIDEYLTRKARQISPAFTESVVYCDNGGPIEKWTLERFSVPPIGLGGSFGTAKRAILALKGAPKTAEQS